MKVLFDYTGVGDKVAIKYAYFMVTFCFHIEFYRMAIVINFCKLKNLKILKGDYWYMYIIMLYPMVLSSTTVC